MSVELVSCPSCGASLDINGAASLWLLGGRISSGTVYAFILNCNNYCLMYQISDNPKLH